MRTFYLLILAALITFPSTGNGAAGGGLLDYSTFLRQVGDLDRLPYLKKDVVSRQFSSYHRGSRYDRETGKCVGMDINGDAGHLLTVHAGPSAAKELEEFKVPPSTPAFAFGDLKWVLDPLERTDVFFLPRNDVREPATSPPENIAAAIPGPGCIYRIWSANPMGTIRFYFDGSTQPMEFNFKKLFLGGVEDPDADARARREKWPFIRPFTFRRAGERDTLASDCYLPIPFKESCIITLDRASFYQFGYKTFPPGTKIETFHLPLTSEEARVHAEAAQKLLERGKDPKPVRPGTETIEKKVEITPGREAVIADLRGPRIVQALHATLEGRERYAHSKTLLRAFFDGETDPSIYSPLVNFFGTGFEPRDYRSFALGYIDSEGYCFFPMPFHKSGRFVVKNEGTRPVTLSYRIVHAPAPDLPSDAMHFKCKYRREEVCSTFDYPLIECRGEGRFCGAALSIDDACRSWWGEGDEKIWVDDDVFPSFFGTGSEDYFGDAWGIRKLNETFFACSFNESNRDHSWTCCYRHQIPDDVPFYKNLKVTIENYPENIWGNKAVNWDEDYVSTAYWYQKPGGSDFFLPVPVEKRRPWGKVPAPPFIEGEKAFAEELRDSAVLIDDEDREREFSRGCAIDLGRCSVGDAFTFHGPELLLEAPYTVIVHTQAGLKSPAAFELSAAGTTIGTSPPDFAARDAHTIGLGVFPKGRTAFTLRITRAGRMVVDGVQFSPARQIPNVFEVETARVVHDGGRTVTKPIGVSWSGGRELRFNAQKPGDAIELELPVPAGSWNINAGLTRGPDRGDYRVQINGRDAGLLRGYAPRLEVKDGVRLGKQKGAAGTIRLRFTCQGRNRKAKGFALGLDYVGWSRIVVENAIEGETADMTDVRGGRFVEQRLGTRFSGERHLWFHPGKVGASFIWPVEVQKKGRYALAVYFTKSWDYAIVRVSFDGRKLGEFDTYAPQVVWGGKTDLGTFDLKGGVHRLKFEIAGRNEASGGILMGIDCITVQPAN